MAPHEEYGRYDNNLTVASARLVIHKLFAGEELQEKLKFVCKIPASLVILWMFSWTPYAIVALIGISGYQHLLTPGRKVVFLRKELKSQYVMDFL